MSVDLSSFLFCRDPISVPQGPHSTCAGLCLFTLSTCRGLTNFYNKDLWAPICQMHTYSIISLVFKDGYDIMFFLYALLLCGHTTC